MDPITRKGDHQKQKKRRSHPPVNSITRRKRRSYDRLSQLPDELLISILSSSLTIKEAARTSILSKRWKTLWTYFYGFLDFDFHPHLRFEECTGDYINYVNKVLTCHQGFGTVPINKLRIRWYLHDEYKSVIDSWVDFAMKKRVQHLEVDLCLPDANYKFPHGIGFPNLTVLQLTSVDLTDETLAYLISSDKCPSLQHISVKYAPSLVHVKVVGNSKLKSFEFSVCWKLKDVEISSAVNLVSFRFSGKKDTKITFEDVPSLTEARFGLDYCENVLMQPLSSPFSQLEVLVLDFTCIDRYLIMSQSSPKFDRIKRLELQSHTPSWNVCVMTMIYRCPRLQKISLEMNDIGISGVRRALHQKIHYKHRHECLQAVEYKGWNGDEDDLELITIILKNTVLLDKVTIDPRTIFAHKFYDKEREKDARRAAKKLRRILPRRVSLVIL